MLEFVSFPGFGIEPFHMEKTFTVFGRPVAWYGVIICIGIILAVTYSLLRGKYTENVSVDTLTDLAFFLVVFGIIGARLYYVVFEFDRYLVTGQGFFCNLGGTLKNIISVWEGGLAIYGAIIAGFITILLFCKIKKLNLLKVLDLAAPGVMIGQLIGRWGNFVNVEAYGSETTLPWRMGIHKSMFEAAPEFGAWYGEAVYVHPTFLYESLWNLAGFVIANVIYRKKKFDGQIVFFYFTWYGFGRMLIEGLRTDSLYLGPVRISQLVGALTFVLGVVLTVVFYKRNRSQKIEALDGALVAVTDDSEAESAENPEETKSVDTDAEKGAENGEDN